MKWMIGGLIASWVLTAGSCGGLISEMQAHERLKWKFDLLSDMYCGRTKVVEVPEFSDVGGTYELEGNRWKKVTGGPNDPEYLDHPTK